MARHRWLLPVALVTLVGFLALGLATGGTAEAQAQADAPPGLAPPWLAWHTEQVSEDGSRPADVAFTSQGEPRILYGPVSTLAKPTPTGWETESLEGEVGDIAIDDEDTVWVVYRTKTSTSERVINNVTVAHRSVGESGWMVEHVDEGVDPALALDGEGTVHVIYDGLGERNGSELRHAIRQGPNAFTVSTIQQVPHHTSNFGHSDLAAHPDTGLHAVFDMLNQTNDQVDPRYGHYDTDAEEWSFTWLPMCGFDSKGAGIDTDPEGLAHVACRQVRDQAPQKGLVHAYQTPTGTWEGNLAANGDDTLPPRVDQDTARNPTIAISQDGTVHMAWRTTTDPLFPDNPLKPGQLYYTSTTTPTDEDAEYATELVDGSGTGVGKTPGLGTCNNQPWIAYEYAWRSRELRRTVGITEPANPSGNLYMATPLLPTLSLSTGC